MDSPRSQPPRAEALHWLPEIFRCYLLSLLLPRNGSISFWSWGLFLMMQFNAQVAGFAADPFTSWKQRRLCASYILVSSYHVSNLLTFTTLKRGPTIDPTTAQLHFSPPFRRGQNITTKLCMQSWVVVLSHGSKHLLGQEGQRRRNSSQQDVDISPKLILSFIRLFNERNRYKQLGQPNIWRIPAKLLNNLNGTFLEILHGHAKSGSIGYHVE